MATKIIKKAEVKRIAEITGMDVEDLAFEVEFLNRNDGEMLASDVRKELALYLMSREVAKTGGINCDARSLFSKIDFQMQNKSGYCRSLALAETLGQNGHSRWMIAELNMGLNHLSLSEANPYTK